MNTHLLSWNPDKWDWIDLDSAINDLQVTGVYRDSWSCGINKSIQVGDRLFLIRLGKEPKGICASGYAISNVYQGAHWSGNKSKLANYISFEYDVLLNPTKDKILGMDILKMGVLAEQHWSTQNSGIMIRPNVAEELEKIWFNFILDNHHIQIDEQLQNDTDLFVQTFEEGEIKQITSTKYERNPYARQVCISHFGLKCSVCDFDFGKFYGDLGTGFIHVHHIKPVATRKGKYEINPINDLRPVCPNCHAMIHRKKQELSIDELKETIKTGG
ncbi:MAG: HNH endonuclease [Bacteroidetes bacterium]|nr:HNH endonuclease [Bacteroidota bacterium]